MGHGVYPPYYPRAAKVQPLLHMATPPQKKAPRGVSLEGQFASSYLLGYMLSRRHAISTIVQFALWHGFHELF